MVIMIYMHKCRLVIVSFSR